MLAHRYIRTPGRGEVCRYCGVVTVRYPAGLCCWRRRWVVDGEETNMRPECVAKPYLREAKRRRVIKFQERLLAVCIRQVSSVKAKERVILRKLKELRSDT